LCVAAAATTLAASESRAIGVRGDVRMTASYVDHRLLLRESIPESEVEGDGVVRRLPDGTTVYCIPGEDCYWYRAAGTESSIPMTQEVRASAWARGGIAARAHVRTRLGTEGFWPRSSERFLAVTAYAELDRARYRVRAGRQEKWGGLGSYRFDGASVSFEALEGVQIEGFVGRSLGRAATTPGIGDLLEDADDLAPDEPSVLWGFQAGFAPWRGLSGSAIYQREERFDGPGLYSERAALDARWSARRTSADLSLDWNFAITEMTEARLRLAQGISRDVSLRLEGRRYQPSFDLWTIWNVFSPIAYLEERGAVSWALRPGLLIEIEEAYRNYEDTSTESEAYPIETDGWRFLGSAHWNSGRWSSTAAYRLHQGFGAFKSAVDASVRHRIGARAHVGAFGSGTQQFAEFRSGEHVMWGGGVEGRAAAGRLGVEARAGVDRHRFEDRPRYEPVTQWRGTLALTFDFGKDPGEGQWR
jgi:hypothetical protein